MTPTDLKAIRKALCLTQSGLAALLELSPKNGDRSVRVWESEGATIPGPVAVAVRYIARERLRDPSSDSVSDLDEAWTETCGTTPFIPTLEAVYARGRYGDIFGPVPFGLIHPAAWQGEMGNASLDLVAVRQIAIEKGVGL